MEVHLRRFAIQRFIKQRQSECLLCRSFTLGLRSSDDDRQTVCNPRSPGDSQPKEQLSRPPQSSPSPHLEKHLEVVNQKLWRPQGERALLRACLSSDLSAIMDAFRLIADEIRHHGISVGLDHVRGVVRMLRKQGRRDELMEVARMSDLPLDMDCLRVVQESLGMGEDAEGHVELLGLWRERGMVPDFRILFSAYHALRKADRGMEANEVLSELRQHMRGGTLHLDDVSLALQWLSDYGLWQDALTVLQAHEEVITRHTSDDAVQCLNLTLRACAKAGEADVADDLLTRWDKGHNLCDAKSYSRLAEAYLKARRFSEAESLLPRMKSRGLSPPEVMYDEIITRYCKLRRVTDAVRVLEMMISDRARPSGVTMSALATVMVESGSCEQAAACIETADAVDIRLPSTIYDAVIRALAKAGMAERALEMLHSLKHQAFPVEYKAYGYSAVIHAYAKSGRWADAVQILHTMRGEGCKPGLRTYDDVIQACFRASQNDAVIEVFDLMRKAGLPPKVSTARAVLLAYGTLKRYEDAVDLAEGLLEQPPPASQGAVDPTVVGKRTITDVHRPDVSRRVHVSRRVFAVLFLMSALDGRADTVRRLRRLLQQSRYTVVNELASACAIALARIGEAEEALRVLPSPTGGDDNKLQPDVYEVAVAAVMQALGRGGQWASALYLFDGLRFRAPVGVTSCSAAMTALSHDAIAFKLLADRPVADIDDDGVRPDALRPMNGGLELELGAVTHTAAPWCDSSVRSHLLMRRLRGQGQFSAKHFN